MADFSRCPECGAIAPNHELSCAELPVHEIYRYDEGEATNIPLMFRIVGECEECGETMVFPISAALGDANCAVELLPSCALDPDVRYDCDSCGECAVEVCVDA